MTQKLDKLAYGIIIGIIIPLIGSFIFFAFKNSSYVWSSMIKLAQDYPSLYISYLKLGAILNLIPFYIFNNYYMQKAQRGIIFGTLFWVAVIIYFIYFGK
jgi:hypothetical protein